MKTYILFLRAVNVGGNNMIKMKDLCDWMEELKFKNIKTYLQSGNVVFQSPPKNEYELSQLIANMILCKTNLNIACQIRNVEEIKHINALLDRHESQKSPDSNLFVTLFSELASPENIQKLKEAKTDNDVVYVYGREAIVECFQPYHKTKLTNNLFEKMLKVKATSRNDKTMRALMKEAESVNSITN